MLTRPQFLSSQMRLSESRTSRWLRPHATDTARHGSGMRVALSTRVCGLSQSSYQPPRSAQSVPDVSCEADR